MKDDKHIVVYTCITGNYDTLRDVSVEDGVDYVCFTDGDIKNDKWKIVPMPEDTKSLSRVKAQRKVKICPHIYLPEYDFSIWIDANVRVKSPIKKFLEDCYDEKYSVMIPQHPVRSCIYKEMKACKDIRKDTIENMKPQIDRYKNEGFPENYGLVQSNIIVRKHNEEDCVRLMDKWWSELEKGSHRDQLSFDYARWKNPDVRFGLLDKSTYRSKYFLTEGHRKVYFPRNIAATFRPTIM